MHKILEKLKTPKGKLLVNVIGLFIALSMIVAGFVVGHADIDMTSIKISRDLNSSDFIIHIVLHNNGYWSGIVNLNATLFQNELNGSFSKDILVAGNSDLPLDWIVRFPMEGLIQNISVSVRITNL